MAEEIDETILKIYDTVANQSLWPEVLDRITDSINAAGCIIFEWQGSHSQRKLSAPFYSGLYDEHQLYTYLQKCFEFEAEDQDIFEAHSLDSDAIDLIDDDVLANSISELKLRGNVQILQKFGILHRAAGLLNKDDISKSRFSVQLGVSRGYLTGEERQYLGQVLPHIAKALDVGRPSAQLENVHKNLMNAMDRLTIGVCIVDAQGRVVMNNVEFKRQLDAYNVFQLKINGELTLTRRQDQHQYENLKGSILNHGKFGARPRKEAIATDDENYLCIEMTPLNKSEEFGTSLFSGSVIYSTDTSRPAHCDTALFGRAFGLTKTEASLVEAVSEGLTNAQIADRCNKSVATINVQVKSILSKTQCSTRTQFVRLMMGFGSNFLK